MKYFIPEWDDRVDPDFDFIQDKHSDIHMVDPFSHDIYMWDIFGINNVPFDGLLVSIATLEGNTKKYRKIKELGIHEFFRLPDSFPIMADCGAFSYIDSNNPPYQTNDVLRLYSELGFQYGVSIDHLIVKQHIEQKNDRLKITYINGVEAYNEWKKKYKDDFQLIVAVQGETIPEYIEMFKNFSMRGITHFGFGGLVRSHTSFIISLIDAIIDSIQDMRNRPEHIHFFGVARCQLLQKYKELEDLGITVSVDSASYLRRAWLSSPTAQINYLSPDLSGYTAIRIPISQTKSRINNNASYGEFSQKCLDALRQYDNGKISLESVIELLAQLNQNPNSDSKILDLYKRTLLDRPWEKCSCPICKELGIDVVIFRGNNRNRRRGFHNTYAFYQVLKDPSRWTVLCEDSPFPERAKAINSLDMFRKGEKVLMMVGCTKKKLASSSSICAPANEMYQGTLFSKVKEYSELMGFPYLIISAKYGLLKPNDVICGYDQTLKNREDVENIRPDVEIALEPFIDKFDTICIVAGEQYRAVVRNMMDERWCYLKTRGIGDMVSIVSRAIPGRDHTLDEYSSGK